MRRAANVDVNQREITEALRGVGATVQPIHQIGRGCPDLLVGFRGQTYTLEVKAGKDKLTPAEVQWHRDWRGKVFVVRSAGEALLIIGAVESYGEGK